VVAQVRGGRAALTEQLAAPLLLGALSVALVGQGACYLRAQAAVIAARVGVSLDTARKWRTRFAAAGLAGLTDLPRSGRPRLFTEVQRAEVIALACELPAKHGVPLSTWTGSAGFAAGGGSALAVTCAEVCSPSWT
jgi:hypothetical protein